MKQLLCLLSAASLLAAETGAIKREGSYWVETNNGTIAVPAMQFRVTTTGSVKVQGTMGTRAAYVVRKRVRARTQQEAERLLRQVRVTDRGEGILSVMQAPLHPAYVDVEVQVPRRLRMMTVFTKAGNISATDLDGNVQLESIAGVIDLDRIGGNAVAKTGGGEIRAGSVGGSLKCSSAGGSIRAVRVGGEAWTQTEGGEIQIGQTDGAVHASTKGGNIRVDHAGAFVIAQTAGGRIEVQQARGLVDAENSGGSIEVGAADGVRCEATRGGIRLRGSSGALRAATDAGNILAELIQGVTLKDSLLSTGSGDVTVFIPSNFPITVRALNERGGWARIVSDFPEFSERKTAAPVVTEACLNGCGPVLKISASGTIYLRRQR